MQAQSLHSEDKLIDARAQALTCAQQTCSPILRTECSEMLRRIEADVPTIVLQARDAAGNDLVDVVVSMDGKVVSRQLDGTSLDVDPGPHTFRFELPGEEPIERRVVTYKGSKNRIIQVAPEREPPPVEPPPAAPPPVISPQPDKPVRADTAGSGELRVAGYVIGGVGLIGLGLFAGFGTAGLAERSDLEECRPNCPDDRIEPVRDKLIAADVCLGLGVAAITAGIVLVAVSYSDDAASSDAALVVRASPTADGGLARLAVAF